MTHHIIWPAVVAAVALAFTPPAQADNKPLKFAKEWSGSVADEKLLKDAPTCVTSTKALEKLWTAWKIDGKPPEVDFTKQIIVVGVTPGSKIKLSAALTDKGDLQILGLATDDFGPGFRYVLATVDSEGVKTVNGKDLPKD